MRLALLVVFLAEGSCFATLVARIPALRERFTLDDLRLGLVLAVVPLVAGVGSLVADRIGRRTGVVPVLRVATPVTCAALPGVAAAGSLTLLLAALAVFALALGAVDATMNAHGVALQHAAGRSLMSGFHAAHSLGGILGSLAASAAVAARLPLIALFGFVGATCGVACLVAGHRLDGSIDPVPGRTAATVPRLWRRIAVVGGAVTALFIVDSAVSSWGATFLRSVLAAPEHLTALVYGSYAAAALLGRTAADPAVDRFGAAKVVGAGGLLGAAGLLLVVTASTPVAGLAGFALAGCGLSVIVPQAFAAAGRAVPERPAAAVARINVSVYGGFVLGAPVIGVIAATMSLRTAFVAAFVLVLALTAAASRAVAH